MSRDEDDGFTIMELIAVVIMIVIAILIFFTLQSFFDYTDSYIDHLNEPKVYTGAINRAQQAYLIENDGNFSSSIHELEISISEETENYIYSTQITDNSAFHYAIAKTDYIKTGLFSKKPLKSIIGAVFKIPNSGKSLVGEFKALAIICINDKPGNHIPFEPILNNGVPSCAEGTTESM